MSLMARVRSTETVSMETWFTTKKSVHKFILELKEGIPSDEFRYAIEEVLLKEINKNWGYLTPTTYFRKPSKVYHRRAKKDIQTTEYVCRYFISTNDDLCYTQSKRTGVKISEMDWQSIVRIEMIHKNEPNTIRKVEADKEKHWNRINKARYDEVTWSNLTKDSFPDKKQSFYDISKVFRAEILRGIEEAFQKKENFKYTHSRSKRDFTVSGLMGEDGVYKAWFSSEYSDTANGDYYLLLNPKVAVYYMRG